MKCTVGVSLPNLIYVLIDDRAEFDKIDRPMMDHRENGGKHVLSKSVDGENGMMVIFQHWLPFAGIEDVA